MKLFRQFTWKSLKANRTRTLVTMIGIILSVALLTAVAAGAYSGQQYMIETTQVLDGCYHAYGTHLSADDLEALQNDARVDQVAALGALGYAPLEGTRSEGHPYLYVMAASDNLEDLLPLKLEQGRMPQSETEIALPEELSFRDGIDWKPGDTISLELGERTLDGQVLSEQDPYTQEEAFTARETRIYTVVGIYSGMPYPARTESGYPALTCGSGGENYTVFFTLHQVRDTYAYLAEQNWDGSCGGNYSLLMYSGASANSYFNTMLYGLMGILMGLIMFGSISLIYNSFSISVAERTKQFGLLKSVGATRRQIRYTVLYEALLLCLVGIPVGLLVGCAGIGVTLYALRDHFALLMGVEDTVVQMRLHLTAWILLLSAAVGLLTALISAWIPARRAMRLSPMEALRQTSDIRVSPRQVKTSRLTGKLFGYCGTLASKNFKRNRRKYRATVVSLFLSLVLFISSSAFAMYLTRVAQGYVNDQGYDISYSADLNTAEEAEQFLQQTVSLEGMEEGVYFTTASRTLRIPVRFFSREYLELFPKTKEVAQADCTIRFVRDADYTKLAEQAGVTYDPNAPAALIYDDTKDRIFDENGSYAVEYAILDHRKMPQTLELIQPRQVEGYVWVGYSTDEDGNPQLDYMAEDIYYGRQEQNGPDDGWYSVPAQEAQSLLPLQLGPVLEGQTPIFVTNGLTLLYPYSARTAILGEDTEDLDICRFLYTTSNHKLAYHALLEALERWEMDDSGAFDYAAEREAQRAAVTVVEVFSYGFIVLISLIAAANVFNTISTNIALRRRELAVLQSIGMSLRGLYRMMNYECLIYGLKSLLFGLPVSAGVSWLIFRAADSGFGTEFTLPWLSILLAVISVFLVVFSTMLYAMRKIKSDHLIDVLRCETL